MSYAAEVLRRAVKRLLLVQVLLVLAVSIAFLLGQGLAEFLAAIYGGGIALFNTLVSAQRLRRATDAAVADAKSGIMELYVGAITRFVATPLLVAVGIVVLALEPVGIIAGFAVAQLGYFFDTARPVGR